MHNISNKLTKLVSFILSIVMCCLVFEGTVIYSADLSADGYEQTSILKTDKPLVSDDSKRTDSEGKYDGYIQSLTSFNSDYLRITYTVSGDVNNDTKVFTFQPYDSSWGGWEDNFATIGESVLEDGVYTFTIPTEKIVQSLSTGKTIQGINLSFCPDIGASVTLKNYYSLKTPTDEPTEEKAQLDSPAILCTVTEKELSEAGCKWEGSANAAIYIKITSADKFSWFNAAISLGTDRAGKASSKYIHASACTVKSGGYYIQDGIIGKAGTGNYVFPNVNLNKTLPDNTTQLSDEELKKITIDVRAGTKDTNCELLGIKFKNGAVYPKGFTVPKCESTTLDVTETGERDKLKMTLDYCDKMSNLPYTDNSWQAFQTALAEAKTKYENASLSGEEYASARSALEKVKANLVFVSSEDKGNPRPFRVLTPKEMTEEMGAGWNLGNTMDGHTGFTPAETAWQPYVTTKAMIKSVHDLGINTVRIPVTWGTMIDDENNYKINEKWISRVQDIVDYCISLDMYAIINIHHDGAEQEGWLKVASEDIDSVYEKYERVWRCIAERFKDYDEHLIFESMNEVTSGTNDKASVLFDNPIIMNLNQIFTNVVRSTGSNNTQRWLSVPGHYALPSAVTNKDYKFEIPKDTVSDRLFVAAHIYAGPSNFYMSKDMSATVCELSACTDMLNKIKVMGTTWSDKGVPVIIGEFGCFNKNNPKERAYYVEIFNRACKNAGMLVPCYWDQGWFDRSQTPADYSFSIIDRGNCKPIDKEVTDGLIRGIELSGDVSSIVKNPEIIPFTDINTDKESVDLVIGEGVKINAETAPSSSNDVLLWSSDDESIATVYRGKIRARGIGTTTIKAFSQSGSAQKVITVNVMALENSSADKIETKKDSYRLAVGQYDYIDAKIPEASENSFIFYKSSDSGIVTVSSTGKIVAVKKGFAVITVVSSGGGTKTVPVVVENTIEKDYIDLAINVYYNDSAHKYYSNDVGESIRVKENGQYTLTFDVDKDLSSAGKKAGVTALKNLTAIYIKDLDVTNKDSDVSPLSGCKIKYDKIVVDGNEMTIIKPDPKEAINSSGIFDTGDPINGYDGSAIKEASKSGNIANFTSVSNPKKIEITFTLSDMKFKEPEKDDTVLAESVSADIKNVIIAKEGDTADISVTVLPKDVNSKVSFVSSDESVVSVLSSTAEVNKENGKAFVTIKGIKKGNAEIMAYIDTLEPAVINVTIGEGISTILGDTDGDGKLTVNDAVNILEYVLKDKDTDVSLYDFDKNGIIDARDASGVLCEVLKSDDTK